jgi:hypothetical protein
VGDREETLPPGTAYGRHVKGKERMRRTVVLKRKMIADDARA